MTEITHEGGSDQGVVFIPSSDIDQAQLGEAMNRAARGETVIIQPEPPASEE